MIAVVTVLVVQEANKVLRIHIPPPPPKKKIINKIKLKIKKIYTLKFGAIGARYSGGIQDLNTLAQQQVFGEFKRSPSTEFDW